MTLLLNGDLIKMGDLIKITNLTTKRFNKCIDFDYL